MEECCSEKEKCCSANQTKYEEEEEDQEGCLSDFFLDIADEAWCEVLKDKIKEHILATQGSRMEELAKIVSESNGSRWKYKMEATHNKNSLKEKLCMFFGHSKQ